jgi:hypothetical protein
MSFVSTTYKVTHVGNGAATTFAYPFLLLDAAHMQVTQISPPGVKTPISVTAENITGVGNVNGGSVTVPTAVPNGHTLELKRVPPFVQDTDLPTHGFFTPETIESALDEIVMMIQLISGDGATQQWVLDQLVAVAAGAIPRYTTATKPIAGSTWLGKQIRVKDAALPEILQICMQKADDSYEWTTVAVAGF